MDIGKREKIEFSLCNATPFVVCNATPLALCNATPLSVSKTYN